jgi:hypothetical protein
MGALEQVIKMKRQGISDEEIISNLSQQKISPREINDAMKQAQIKNAVSDFSDEDMQLSMMPEEAPVPIEEEAYAPQQQEYGTQQQRHAKFPSQEEYIPSPNEQYEPQQQYSQQEQYQPQEQIYSPQEGNYSGYSSGGISTDTVIELAEQIFSDKIRKFQKQSDASSESISLLQTRVENISERLKKIETLMDKLQIAILEKVGSYGQNLEGIKKEMSMMQDSFSKMVSPVREVKQSSQKNEYPKENEEYSSEPFPIEVKNIKKKNFKKEIRSK